MEPLVDEPLCNRATMILVFWLFLDRCQFVLFTNVNEYIYSRNQEYAFAHA